MSGRTLEVGLAILLFTFVSHLCMIPAAIADPGCQLINPTNGLFGNQPDTALYASMFKAVYDPAKISLLYNTSVTLMVPDDLAFADLLTALRLPADPKYLGELLSVADLDNDSVADALLGILRLILQYHVLEGRLSARAVSSSLVIPTLAETENNKLFVVMGGSTPLGVDDIAIDSCSIKILNNITSVVDKLGEMADILQDTVRYLESIRPTINETFAADNFAPLVENSNDLALITITLANNLTASIYALAGSPGITDCSTTAEQLTADLVVSAREAADQYNATATEVSSSFPETQYEALVLGVLPMVDQAVDALVDLAAVVKRIARLPDAVIAQYRVQTMADTPAYITKPNVNITSCPNLIMHVVDNVLLPVNVTELAKAFLGPDGDSKPFSDDESGFVHGDEQATAT